MLLESDGETAAQPILWPHFMTPEGLIWTPPRLELPVAGEATLTSASRAGPPSFHRDHCFEWRRSMKRARPSIWPTFLPTAAAMAETPLPLASTIPSIGTAGESEKLSRRAFDQPRSPLSPMFLVGFRGRF